MAVLYILGGIVLAVVGVLGWLYYSLKLASRASLDAGAVPVEVVVATPVPAPVEAEQVPVAVAVQEDGRQAVLQEEVRLAQEKIAAMGRDFNEVLANIRQENAQLRADIDRLQQLNTRLNEEDMAHLKAENAAFKAQVDALDADRLNAELAALKEENDSLRSAAMPVVPLHESAALNAQAVDALKEDVEVLRSERARTEIRIDELEELLRDAQEKNSFLQYELTKSRAHVVGVERICDNARRQFEGISREVHDVEQDNELLKKQSNVLEQSLMDFKNLNSELLKRERLTQFELENNRTQLKDLEHIYQVFRSRLQSAGINEASLATKS